jgi:hypothetical protein
MSRGTERVLVGYPARAGPRSALTRGVSAEAVREAASLLVSLGQQVQEVAIEVEEGYADNFIKVWIAQTGDEVTRTSGSAGASSTSTSSSRSAARCTSSRARSTPRLPGRARLAAPLLAAADRDVGAGRRAGHAHARQAGCRSACRSWAARGRGAPDLACRAARGRAALGGPARARRRPERLPPLVRPRRPPAWR